MPRSRANGIDLAWDAFGGGEPLLLVMGIGAQRVFWPDPFCEALADRGFRVIRFDNRDVGESTWIDAGAPDLATAIGRFALGLPVPAPYTLSDMAADAAGLLDALGVGSAHVVGASMGGMIAQHLAIEQPGRVRSLTSLMSTPGGRRHLGRPSAMRALLGPRPRSREEAQDRAVALFRVIGSPGHPRDEAALRAMAGVAWDRGANPQGFARQLAAILASGSRRAALGAVRAPTLVVHGAADPLVPPDAGRATAACIPGARFELIPGMGHDLPAAIWPRLADAIARNAFG